MQQVRQPSSLVGIVTRNRVNLLPRAITSALNQTTTNVRVAVIDDASSDDTPALAPQFPQVHWSRRSQPLGYMSARNELMATEGIDYYASLDDDAWIMSGDELARAIEHLERNPRTAAIAFDILSPDRPQQAQRSLAQAAPMFIGCGHVLRIAAVRQVGGYESLPGSYGTEEKDLSLRLLDAGYGIVMLPGVHVWHEKTSMARQIPEQHRSGVCNDLVMTVRRTPGLLLPPALLAKIYRHLYFAMKARLVRPCLEGFLLFFRSIPQAWRTRRPVRASTLRTFVALARS